MTNRSILRRLSKFSLFTFVALVAVLLLVAATLSARLAAGPLSVAFLGPRLQEELVERIYYAYDVKFDDLELRCNDGHGNLGLAMVGVRIADCSLQDIATVPEIVAGLDLGNVINGDLKPVAITIVRPKIRWIKTVGGAVKFDIGAKKPGDSGKIFEDFLITLASAPDPGASENKILPDMRIVDADILIGNELANTEMHISDADILIAPHADGVRSVFDLAVETAAAPVNISAVGLYRTEDQQIELELNFDDLTLDGFGAMLPDTIPDILLRESLSGTVELDMDKFFSIKAAVFDLSGEAHMGARLVSMKIEGSLVKTRWWRSAMPGHLVWEARSILG
jgi:hypothetical protein